MKKYTIEEFRAYLLSQDSMGDMLYNLSEENIDIAIANSNKQEVEAAELEKEWIRPEDRGEGPESFDDLPF